MVTLLEVGHHHRKGIKVRKTQVMSGRCVTGEANCVRVAALQAAFVQEEKLTHEDLWTELC